MYLNKYIKLFSTIFTSTIILIAIGCNENDIDAISSHQKQLIGRAVKFIPSVDEMISSRANHDGFNSNDLIYIYRQGLNENNTYRPEEGWVVYNLKTTIDPISQKIIDQNWYTIIGAKGYRGKIQTEADSIYWENGKSVRFRAWAKSSITNYNDYLYADYATLPGPVESVPLTFKHLGCRIGFTPRAGNQIIKIGICTDKDDYMREDNADSSDDDQRDKLTEEEATNTAEEVKNVYNRMCIPAGVQMYSDSDNDGYEWGTTNPVNNPTPQYGRLMAKGNENDKLIRGKEATEGNTSRPVWTNLEGRYYTIAIPYDMSDSHYGSAITLPAKTRFRVYLYNINDSENNGNDKAKYHIFSLTDLKSSDGNALYPDGLTLRAGYSHLFTIGYLYNQLTVSAVNNMAWNEQDLEAKSAQATEAAHENEEYQWWINAMNKATETALSESGNGAARFNPIFHIRTIKEFKGFINIVNGTLPQPTQDPENEGNINYDDCLKFNEFIPQDGTTPATSKESYQTKNFDFKGFTIFIDNDLDFNDEITESIGTLDAQFAGILKGNMKKLINCNFNNGVIFGYTSQATIEGMEIHSTKSVSIINNANKTNIYGICVKGPGSYAIGKNLKECVIKACCHWGVGNDNQGLIEGGSDNSMFGCYVTNGIILKDGIIKSNDDNIYSSGNYYYSQDGNISYTDYNIRGVISSVMKAYYDNIPPITINNYNSNQYYGIAPWRAMNYAIKESGYHYENSNYYNKYPILKIGNPSETQYTSWDEIK